MYEINFEINNQSIDANFELVQNSATAELILNVTPDRTSMLVNDSGFINKDVNNLSNYMLTADITAALNGKVDKETGKGLSTNDFTNAYKTKLEGIEAGAEVNTVLSVNGQTGNVVIDIPDSATWGNITGSLNNQTDLKNALASKQNNLTATYGLTITGDVISGKEITDVVDGISAVIPSQATEQNQLADKNFVNSSISTNTANFIGTFNSVAELEAYSGTVTNNDYAFVVGMDAAGNTVYNRYKYNGSEWLFEYALNNSSFTSDQWASINSGITSSDVTAIGTALQPNDNISLLNNNANYITSSALSDYVPYSSATGAVDLNAQNLKNIGNLAVGTATVDSNEKLLSVGQNRFVTNNQNGLFISSTTSQTRKGMYGVPMALEIQFNSNNQAYSYPLGFHDMNINGNGGQFLFTSFSSNIGAATAGDVMVENDKGGLIFNTGNSKTGSKMRFTVGNWQSTPQLTLTANGVGIKNLNPNSSYALDVNGSINASDVKVNGVSVGLPSQSGNDGKFLTTDGSTASWAEISTSANVEYTGSGGTTTVDLSELYIDSYGASYSFYYNNGVIINDNQQIDDSYAYALIYIDLASAGDVTVYFTQDSEQSYDFGEISEIDQYLNQDNYEDIDYVAWSGKSYSEISDSITFTDVQAGSHFFTVKYIKDSSSESGSDSFSITGIEISGGSGTGSLIDTTTQQEIPLSQINDMPHALQSIIDQIPDIGDLSSDYVTINTSQKIQAAKAIFGNDVAFGTDTTQKNLLAVISNSNSTAGNWIGRLCVGAKNKTFIMGTYGSICVLGAHSWTNAQQGTGAAWEPVYINPDGDKAVYIGGSPINGKQAMMIIQNVNANTTGSVKINRSTNLSNNFKEAACWDDDVRKFSFTSISGYSASSNQMLTHDTSGTLKWVNI